MTSEGATPKFQVCDWVARLKDAAETGDVLDLAPNAEVDSCDAESWPSERTLPIAALRTVLTDADLRVDPKGLRIRAARFVELVDIEGVNFPHRLRFSHCALDAGLDADDARLRSLELHHVHVAGEVRAINASIDGQLTLNGALLHNPTGTALTLDGAKISGGMIAIDGFRATGQVCALGVSIGGQLGLNGATLENPDGVALALDGAKISGGVFAGDGFRATGQVRALDVTIDGGLSLNGATLENPDGVALALDGAKISGGMIAGDGFRATGQVRAHDVTIDGQLGLNGATLENPDGVALALDGAKISGGVFAGDGFRATGQVRALDVTIDGGLSLNGALLHNPNGFALTLDRAEISGGMIAGDGFHATGEVRGLGVTIGGQLGLNGATLENPDGVALALDGAKINGGMFAGDGFHSTGQVRALGVTIGGQLGLNGATLENPNGVALALDGAKIGRDMFVDGFHATGQVHALGATIDGQLSLHGATLENPDGNALSLESAKIGQLILTPASFDGHLNLTRIQITDLRTSPHPPTPVLAAGWKVGDLHGPLRDDWRSVDAWLSSQRESNSIDKSTPVPVQPWHAIAEVYERNGDPAGARRLRFAAARQVTRQSFWPTKCVRTLYFLAVGHGYYPWLAAFWLSLVLATGVGLVAVNREDIVPTNRGAATMAVQNHFGIEAHTPGPQTAAKQKQADALLPVTAETPCEAHPGYPCMSSLAFAINTVLPPAASINRDWDTSSDATIALIAGLPLLKLLSWAFAALLLAGVTGLLRKN